MADYPSQVKTFRLGGVLGRGVADTTDTGDAPDLMPIVNAKITAVPNIDTSARIGPVFKVPLATPPQTIWQDAIYGTTDVNGNVVTADSSFTAVSGGTAGMVIPWGGSPGILPIGWTWTITIQVGTFPADVFIVYGSDGGYFDITTLVPVPVSPGTEVSNWAAVVAEVTAIRDQVLSVGNGTGTTPSGTGADGLSAYQVALKNGFVGSETQWLTSLKGVAGNAGLSAYQLALANGFVGTQTTWLASLVGAQGAPGSTGVSDIDMRIQNPDGTYPTVGTRVKIFWGATPPAAGTVTAPALFIQKPTS
jgi:hypothetical protein